MKKLLRHILLCIILVFGVTSNAWSLPIYGNSTTGSTEGIGSFTGDFQYTSASNTSASILLSLTNTSPAGNGGYITGVALNNPGNLISGVSFSSSLVTSNFNLIGGSSFNNSIDGNPFGDFDIGAASTNTWKDGGSPTGGIPIGSTELFTFSLTGTGLAGLTTQSFIDELSFNSPSGQANWLSVRLRGFDDDGSDKVPGTPIPEPGTLMLLGSGLMGVAAYGRKRFKK